MNRRASLRVLAAGGAAFALSACDTMPASAVAAWDGPPPQLRDPRLRALAWALLAPNPHNLQSWTADLRDADRITLYVDRQRLLPRTDPTGRQILIGCGAFTELLQMAAARDGWRAAIDWMPQGDYDATSLDARPFAQVRLARDTGIATDPCFDAVRLRRTHRGDYAARPPEDAAWQALSVAARRHGVDWAGTADPKHVADLRALAIAGYQVEFGSSDTWSESADALRVGAGAVAAEPSGLPALGTAVWWARHLGLMDAGALHRTDGLAATRAVRDSTQAAEHTPAWGWLVTVDESRRAQLEAGRAYLRVALAAAAHGLAIQPNSQVLQEFAAMQPLYRAFHERVGVAAPARVQMLVRLGYAAPCPAAPRRPLTQIVRT